jgi:hypothetical protein
MKHTGILLTLLAATGLVLMAGCGGEPVNEIHVAPSASESRASVPPPPSVPPTPSGPAVGRVITTTEKEVIRPGGPSVTTREVVVSQAPPPLRQEVLTMAPSPAHLWVPGYWTWNNGWQWVSGRWEQPPQQRTTWMPGQWVQQGPNWVWHPGHWQ